MKILSLTLMVFLMLLSGMVDAQEKEQGRGKVFGSLYMDAFTEFDNTNSKSAMEIRRAYFGYKYNYDEYFQAYLKLDIGSPLELASGSAINRYAYFKNAGLKYHKRKLTVNMGITDVFMYKIQEKYWGHRYINKSFMDRYKFGPKADIGVNASWKFNNFFSMDLGFYNGEGYKHIQGDNTYVGGLGVSIHPFKSLLIRAYGDYSQKTVAKYTGAIFLGYKFKNKLVFGGEYNYQANNKYEAGHHRFGYSFYGLWNINSKWQYFVRYDNLASNILENELIPWDADKDGSAITSGFQYVIIKGITASINYQDWDYYSTNSVRNKYLFLNFEVKF